MCTLASYGKDCGLKTSRIATGEVRLKISQKGLYALHALMTLARRYQQGAITVRDIASESDLPIKFLALILVELKHARIVESVRGYSGGYRLRRAPSEIRLSEIVRMIDGPLAPFGDADQLRTLIAGDVEHRALYQVFLDVRDSAAKILDNTTVADIIAKRPVRKGKQIASSSDGNPQPSRSLLLHRLGS
jgi:Rrf2 family protein